MIDGLTTFNLSFAEHDECLVVFNYKVGSRFVQSVFGNNITEHHLPISINEGFLFDKPAHKEFLNKIKSPSYNKKIIILYRNPYEKILSGFIEDFQEVGLRPSHKDEYVEKQFLNHGGNYDYNKTTLQLLRELTADNDTFYNTQNTYELFEKELIHKKLSASTAYCDLIHHYINWRLDTNTVDEKHTSYHCIPVYIILKEFLEEKEIVLFDLDNKSISLKDILQIYCLEEIVSEKKDFSNDKVKEVIRNFLRDKTMEEKIRRSLKYETIIYELLKMDYRNYKNGE